MKILSFGHIPSWAGGRQSSGLANVIFQLANGMSSLEDCEVAIAATDVYEQKIKQKDLIIFGWTKSYLLKFIILHPFVALYWFIGLCIAKVQYGPVIEFFSFFFKGLHLRKTIELFKPDIVHLHGVNACVYDKIIPHKQRIIVTMHGLIGDNMTIENNRYMKKMEQKICSSNYYTYIFFIASQLIVDFERIYGKIKSPVKAIPNTYNSAVFYYVHPKPHDKLTLMTIASLSENKGQQRVIKALANSKLDYKYICLGAATDERIESNASLALNLNVDYEYIGKKSSQEIREILAIADYMIMPSSTEGFGLVYMEAIACGVPVILPKHLPIVHEKDIINNDNSILLEDSSVDAIAKLLPLLSQYKFNHKSVSESISHFSWRDIAKEYIESINLL